jgi:hypothetical protein
VGKSGPFVAHYLRWANGLMTNTNIPVDFTHVQITPSIAFNAVTFELAANPSWFPQYYFRNDPATRYYALTQQQCAISPTHVFVPKLGGDMGMKLLAMGACRSANGSDTLQSTIHYNKSLSTTISSAPTNRRRH